MSRFPGDVRFILAQAALYGGIIGGISFGYWILELIGWVN